MRIKITSDSTCDLPPELIQQYDIGITPLGIVMGENTLKDRVEIQAEDIFRYVESGEGVCHTVAVNVAEYYETFTEALKTHDAVIHFNLSSKISSCNQNALIAASELKNVYVVDTLSLSTGSGHLVLDAAIMAKDGLEPLEIVNKSLIAAKKVEASFVIDSLTYLHKGGRCSGLAAMGANLLKLKPCIEMTDGAMDVGKKYRGSFEKAVLQYASDKLAGRRDIDFKRIFITYPPRTPADAIAAVETYIKENFAFKEVIRSEAGCTISNHCGTVTLGVLFYRK